MAERTINGVVGNSGINIPIVPIIKDTNPRIIRILLFKVFL
ncbi:MAG: hypothetical protein ACLFSQ_07530 [Candidatus Zixiibacteriota bacterium]